MEPVVGTWITWNQGTCIVSAEIRGVHEKRGGLLRMKRIEFEVESWVIVEEPGSCYRYPMDRVSFDDMAYLRSVQITPPIQVNGNRKIVQEVK